MGSIMKTAYCDGLWRLLLRIPWLVLLGTLPVRAGEAHLLLVPLLLWLYPPRYSHGRDALAVVGLYLVALLLDRGDRALFALTDSLVGGHALKYLVAALAAWLIAHHLRRRRAA